MGQLMAKLTKSVTFNTETDADLLAWLDEQRGQFAAIVREILYAAMEADQDGADQALDLAGLQAAVRTAIRDELQAITLAPAGESCSPPAPPDTGEINEDLKAQLLGSF